MSWRKRRLARIDEKDTRIKDATRKSSSRVPEPLMQRLRDAYLAIQKGSNCAGGGICLSTVVRDAITPHKQPMVAPGDALSS